MFRPSLLALALLATAPLLAQAAAPAAQPIPRAQFIADMDVQFRKMDADKNGQLSPAEFAKVTAPAPAANGQPMIARMDSNRDSQVNLIEHRTATLANFDRLDVDKDGVVTPAEMKAGGIGK